ncbi:MULTISPECIES: hypothetical protein, partial [unclassified Achromobacter]|uniref:hypothetical protein n=1 Tax=unclassified Achromobacter TaxID=2626865 RepID=UPI001178BE55
MTHPQSTPVSLRSKLAAALTDCPHTLEHDRVELRSATGQQGGNTLAQILNRLEAAFALAHPHPTGWRDLATAPKDGSVVHVAWSPDDWTIGSAFYTDGKWVASAIFYCLNS